MEAVIQVPDTKRAATVESSPESDCCQKLKPYSGRLLSVAIFAAFCVGVVILMFERRRDLERFLAWIHTIGIWGNACIVLLFVVISFPVPLGYSFLALAAGFLYNLWEGMLTVVLGASVLGAPLAFVIMGRCCQSWSEQKIGAWPRFRAVLFAVRKHGFKIAFLMRLTPVPFGFQNTLFSVSGITFWPYVAGTALGLLPEQFAWVYFGTTCKKITQIVNRDAPMSPLEKAMLAVEVIAVVLVVGVIGYFAKRAMKQATDEYEASSAGRPADEEAAQENRRLIDDYDRRDGSPTEAAAADDPALTATAQYSTVPSPRGSVRLPHGSIN